MNHIASLPRILSVLAAFMVFSLPLATARAQPTSSDATGEVGGPVNAMCPVTQDEPIDPRFTAVYEGRTIGLCCRKCRTKFEADPAAYIANLSVAFDPPAPDGGDADPTAHAHDDPADETNETHDDDHNHDPSTSAEEAASTQLKASGTEPDEHAHSHDTGSRAKLAVWIGKFHPASTHLPIGLLIGAAIAELGMIATRKVWFRHAAGFCLTIAALAAIATASLGWFNGGFVLWDDDWVQGIHRWLGTGTAALSLLSLVLFARIAREGADAPRVTAYRVSLFLTALVVATTGFFGGALVYGLDHYAW